MNLKTKIILMAVMTLFGVGCAANDESARFLPGQVWNDTSGKPINAHGGGVIHVDGVYYWYGEHKLPALSEEQKADGGVHLYTSTDLYNWDDRGLVLEVDYHDPQNDISYGCILERPKVIFNEPTGRYVMYFKLYPAGTGYEAGYIGVAYARDPAGPFVYSHKFLGADSDKGSGDFCLFHARDGYVYHLTVRKPDKVFVAGKLAHDYSSPRGPYMILEHIPPHTEAPALVTTGGFYYMVGSGSTGWEPNPARSFRSRSISGPWEDTGNPCSGTNPHNGLDKEKTFGGQVSSIFPVTGKKDAYIAMFDIWKPEMPIEGLYVWLPVDITSEGLKIRWRDEWDLSVFDN